MKKPHGFPLKAGSRLNNPSQPEVQDIAMSLIGSDELAMDDALMDAGVFAGFGIEKRDTPKWQSFHFRGSNRNPNQPKPLAEIYTPWKICIWNQTMEVDGRWCCFSTGWFLGSMLIFIRYPPLDNARTSTLEKGTISKGNFIHSHSIFRGYVSFQGVLYIFFRKNQLNLWVFQDGCPNKSTILMRVPNLQKIITSNHEISIFLKQHWIFEVFLKKKPSFPKTLFFVSWRGLWKICCFCCAYPGNKKIACFPPLEKSRFGFLGLCGVSEYLGEGGWRVVVVRSGEVGCVFCTGT